MEYQALYRRWRPRNFADFIGQNHVVTTLSNAIAGNRIAHAYLFTGPRGTGKTSAAKILAKALNCIKPEGPDPCDSCINCTGINEGVFMDVLEIDGASNRGIDEIRDLREKVKFAPVSGKYKIYIIDEVHMLTAEAFNALLKTLEEPPRFVIFILATTEAHKIPPTILSRCQRFDFKRFTVDEIEERLLQILKSEGIHASMPALELIAEYSEGGMRDALSLLEQALAHSKDQLEESDVRAILGLIDQEEINRITQAIKNKDIKTALILLNNICLDGKDLFLFGRSLITHFRGLLLSSVTTKADSQLFSPDESIRIIEIIAGATNDVKKSNLSSLPLELALIKIISGRIEHENLEARVVKLEAMLKSPNTANITMAVPTPAELKTEAPVLKTSSASAGEKIPDHSRLFNEWTKFIEMVKNKKRTLAALIQEGKPLGYKPGELVVGFPPNLKFHLENLALPQNKEFLESVLSDLLGEKTQIICIPISDNSNLPNPEPELVAKTLDLFGGDIHSISKED